MIESATVFGIMGSNIYWHWGNDWLVCAFALICGWAVGIPVKAYLARRAGHKMQEMYGKDWIAR